MSDTNLGILIMIMIAIMMMGVQFAAITIMGG
jgi:hypothetical protein